MKASIKFREEAPPLVRAKIPVAVLGLPFLSGFAVGADGDAFRDVRFDLATAFRVGPSLRLSYRPNDDRKPFSLILKTGTGTLGSPCGNSPLVMSAEFGLQSGRPAFSLLFKPNFGDFSIKKVVDGAAPVDVSAESPPAVEIKVSAVRDEKNPEFVEFHAHEPIDSGKQLSGVPIDLSTLATGSRGGIDGLLSGFEVSARSILHLPKRAAVRFKWGLRAPPELRSALDDPKGPISLSKLPLLSLSKITIERSMADAHTERKKKKSVAAENTDASALLRRDVEALRADSILLKGALEDLRAEVEARKFTPAASAAARKEEQGSNGKPISRNTGKSERFPEEPKKASATSSTAAGA